MRRGRFLLLPLGLGLALPRAASADVPIDKAISRIAADAQFDGWVLVADRNRILSEQGAGTIGSLAPDERFTATQIWPWASVTKQVVATMVMQQVAEGRIDLDRNAADYLPALAGPIAPPTVRQLLQHRAGLRNPDDSPKDARGTPSFYWGGPTGLDWCLGGRAAAGGDWRYNNCDYIVLGALLEKVAGTPFDTLFRQKIARPVKLRSAAMLEGKAVADMVPAAPAYVTALPRYGSAGALAGTARDMLAFDRALLNGKLLPAKARDTLWAGDPALGYMALGQWVFSVPVKGCKAPVRIVERRGGIGDFQVRNLILPDLGLFVIAFTNRETFDFGEIWTGKGFSHDLLQQVACTET
ncbi:hypothetical protein Sbs19_07160 [Sphingobium sp. BS19]|nr:hypothetical protein Sbs19_07160 [Sphingobium sp. BS19]